MQFLLQTVTLLACTKETKDEPYNPDGSPITMEQALEICKEEIDYYEWVEISTRIVKRGTAFTNSLDNTNSTYKVPYDSWIVIINTEPLANSGKFWLYIYVDAKTGRTDYESWQWGVPCEIDIQMVKFPFNRGKINSIAEQFRNVGTHGVTMPKSVAVSNNWAVTIIRWLHESSWGGNINNKEI